MTKFDKYKVENFILSNRYMPSVKAQAEYRDTYSFVEGKNEDEPAVVTPGGVLGDIINVLSTGVAYGIEIDREKAVEAVKSTVKIYSWSSLFAQNSIKYWEEYGVSKADKEVIESTVIKTGLAPEKTTRWSGAVVILEGKENVHPLYIQQSEDVKDSFFVPILQQYYLSLHRRRVVHALITQKAVPLRKEDEEYLYQIMSDISEINFYLTLRHLSPELPLYAVTFKKETEFEIEELGEVT